VRVNSKPFHFEVQIVPLETYPDLVKNPTNPYAQMSEKDRLEDLIDILGLLWAEACLEKARRDGKESKTVEAPHPENSHCKYHEKGYHVSQKNIADVTHGQPIPNVE